MCKTLLRFWHFKSKEYIFLQLLIAKQQTKDKFRWVCNPQKFFKLTLGVFQLILFIFILSEGVFLIVIYRLFLVRFILNDSLIFWQIIFYFKNKSHPFIFYWYFFTISYKNLGSKFINCSIVSINSKQNLTLKIIYNITNIKLII